MNETRAFHDSDSYITDTWHKEDEIRRIKESERQASLTDAQRAKEARASEMRRTL